MTDTNQFEGHTPGKRGWKIKPEIPIGFSGDYQKGFIAWGKSLLSENHKLIEENERLRKVLGKLVRLKKANDPADWDGDWIKLWEKAEKLISKR